MGYEGPVRVSGEGGDVSEIRVVLRADDGPRSPHGWGGRVVNSDYVLWGISGHRVTLHLPDGRTARCAVHASGRLTGLGPPPWPDPDDRSGSEKSRSG